MHYNPLTEKTQFFGDYRVHHKYSRLDSFTKSLICHHKQDNALYGIHISEEAKLFKFNP